MFDSSSQTEYQPFPIFSRQVDSMVHAGEILPLCRVSGGCLDRYLVSDEALMPTVSSSETIPDRRGSKLRSYPCINRQRSLVFDKGQRPQKNLRFMIHDRPTEPIERLEGRDWRESVQAANLTSNPVFQNPKREREVETRCHLGRLQAGYRPYNANHGRLSPRLRSSWDFLAKALPNGTHSANIQGKDSRPRETAPPSKRKGVRGEVNA